MSSPRWKAPSHGVPRSPGNFPRAYADPRYEVADIFREYGPDYCATHTLTPLQHNAMTAIERCLSGVNYLVRSASIILAGDWTLLFVLGFSS
jgi:hypothetical protein